MNQPERRGDRRVRSWRCTSPERERHLELHDFGVPEGSGCGKVDTRAELPDGRVYCTSCGRVDSRSTQENRREAGRELARLQERIERQMAEFSDRLDRASEERYRASCDVEGLKVIAREALRVAEAARDDADRAQRTADDAKDEAEGVYSPFTLSAKSAGRVR